MTRCQETRSFGWGRSDSEYAAGHTTFCPEFAEKPIACFASKDFREPASESFNAELELILQSNGLR